MKGNIIEKMIDHPLATFIVVGTLVDATSVLLYNIANIVGLKQ